MARRKGGYPGFKSKRQWRRPLGLREQEAVGARQGAQDQGAEEGPLPQAAEEQVKRSEIPIGMILLTLIIGLSCGFCIGRFM